MTIVSPARLFIKEYLTESLPVVKGMTTEKQDSNELGLDPKLVDDTIVGALAQATNSRDTREKFKKALDSTGSAKEKAIKKALMPDKPVLSPSTTGTNGTKGPKGTKSPGDPRVSSKGATNKDDLVDYISGEVQKQMSKLEKRNPVLEGKQAARSFVTGLFEALQHEEAMSKKDDAESKETEKEEEQEERKYEKSDVRELEKALDRIPQRYFEKIDTAQEAVEAIMNGVMDRLSLDDNDKKQFKTLFLKKLAKGL